MSVQMETKLWFFLSSFFPIVRGKSIELLPVRIEFADL